MEELAEEREAEETNLENINDTECGWEFGGNEEEERD